jgi:hypothetical protein
VFEKGCVLASESSVLSILRQKLKTIDWVYKRVLHLGPQSLSKAEETLFWKNTLAYCCNIGDKEKCFVNSDLASPVIIHQVFVEQIKHFRSRMMP